MDVQRLFVDSQYKQLMIEYHKFVTFILNDINRCSIKSSSVNISGEDNALYIYKNTFVQMLQNTFPTFVITETYNDDDIYTIHVSWSN